VFQALPETRILVHVYVDQPEQRFVILNSRKLRQGDSSPEGLGMEEILPNGVVLSFQGHSFFIPR
jgi:general secretion pathway protein B